MVNFGHNRKIYIITVCLRLYIILRISLFSIYWINLLFEAWKMKSGSLRSSFECWSSECMVFVELGVLGQFMGLERNSLQDRPLMTFILKFKF